VLDLGSGPGTGLWAAALEFPSLERATALERDLQFIAVAQRLCADGAEWGEPPLLLRNTRWITGDLNAALGDEIDGSFDLVLCSYALNELTAAQRKALLERLWNGVTLTLPAAGAGLIDRAWKGTAGILLLVEPGTKAGFANLNAARSVLLDLGAEIVAPCPHKMGCPMAAGGDWCHFAARLERTAEHRRLKAAELGHEDEKFSYLAVRRPRVDAEVSGEKENPRKEAAARIVRHPCVFSGYAQLALCRQGEITEARVTRSMKDDWRRLKRLGWGGLW
jgi:ribosomal protein RSM22 (predicted rRNA methylase)